MRHIKDYTAINVMFTYTHFLKTSIFGGDIKENNYTAFRHYSRIIEEYYRPKTKMKNKYTLMGDVICNQREKLPIYTGEAIAEADLCLYQVCNTYDLTKDGYSWRCTNWFPKCYIYAKSMPVEWGKMKSRRYCEKMMALFGVDSLEELKESVSKWTFNDKMKYSGSWDVAPAILNCIKVEDIGTLN